MRKPLLQLSVLALLAVSSFPVAAEELEATVKIAGREIAVQVRHPDGRSAARAPVRLLYGRQLTVAVGRTDQAGLWVHTVSQTGAYEVVVESGSSADEIVRLQCTVLDGAEASVPPGNQFPWATAVLALVSISGILLLIVVGTRNAKRRRVRIRWSQLLPLAALLAVGSGWFGWSAWAQWNRPALTEVPPDPNVASAARDYLRNREVKPLSGSLERLLSDTASSRIRTQPHPLLGQHAPDFELADHGQRVWRLKERLSQGLVVLVFYYGYHCNHCVGQLFALHDDVQKFRELGSELVAVSADPPELTRERFRQYGEFAFPVLSDPGNKVAQAYGVYQPASGKQPEELRHGTFVIGRDGCVHWAQSSSEPFTGNLTLLYELARLEGRLPVPSE